MKKFEVKYEMPVSVENFIKNVCKDYLLELKDSFEVLGENPLHYRERQLSSFLFPALLNNSKKSLMEVSYYKEENIKGDDKKKVLYADFYSLSKDKKKSYIIEFKQAWDCLERKDLYKISKDRWERVNEQIENLKKKNVNEMIDGEKDIYGISLYTLVVFTGEQDNKKIKEMLSEKIDNKFSDAHWVYIEEVEDNLENPDDNGVRFKYIVLLGKVKVIDKNK